MPKSQHKWDKKLSSLFSQIKDLHTKLDKAVAKNSQIQELLNPATLQTAFTNALQATQSSLVTTTTPILSMVVIINKANHFWASPVNPSLLLGRTGAWTQTSPAIIARIQAMT